MSGLENRFYFKGVAWKRGGQNLFSVLEQFSFVY
jgi:hypothetical protein